LLDNKIIFTWISERKDPCCCLAGEEAAAACVGEEEVDPGRDTGVASEARG
jgi:hypothetical protein